MVKCLCGAGSVLAQNRLISASGPPPPPAPSIYVLVLGPHPAMLRAHSWQAWETLWVTKIELRLAAYKATLAPLYCLSGPFPINIFCGFVCLGATHAVLLARCSEASPGSAQGE